MQSSDGAPEIDSRDTQVLVPLVKVPSRLGHYPAMGIRIVKT